MSKTRRIAAWILIVLIGGGLIFSAVMKLSGAAEVVKVMGEWNMADWRIPIGVVELATAILLLIPRTHSLGLLLATAYLGGAIATHIQQGEAPFAASPAIMLALLWIAGLLRHPELLVSFRHPARSSEPRPSEPRP